MNKSTSNVYAFQHIGDIEVGQIFFNEDDFYELLDAEKLDRSEDAAIGEDDGISIYKVSVYDIAENSFYSIRCRDDQMYLTIIIPRDPD